MAARLYQRYRNAMQSGNARTGEWVLQFESRAAKRPDPLTGWSGGAWPPEPAAAPAARPTAERRRRRSSTSDMESPYTSSNSPTFSAAASLKRRKLRTPSRRGLPSTWAK